VNAITVLFIRGYIIKKSLGFLDSGDFIVYISIEVNKALK
jgi:hypothetical protein